MEWAAGNLEEAKKASSMARKLGIAALITGMATYIGVPAVVFLFIFLY